MTTGTIKVLLVDDHPIIREGLQHVFANESDLEVVGEAGDGDEALQECRKLQPDVILLDLSMPGQNGIATARELVEQWPNGRIVVFSVHDDKSHVRDLLSVGAKGYVLKRTSTENLLFAIRAAARGEVFVDPSIAGKLVSTYPGSSRLAPVVNRAQLSEREDEILRLIARGLSNKEIAASLGLSVKTVETYKARSMEKLGMKCRADIVKYGIGRGWLAEA